MKAAVGFTLIELLVTVVVLGILAAFTLPNLAPLKAKQDFSQGAALIEDAFRQAQDLAVSRADTVHLIFDLQANRYWLCTAPEGVCQEKERIALPALPDGVYLMDTNFVDSRSRDQNGEPVLDDEVAFDYQGRVVDGADVLARVVLGYRPYTFLPYEIYLASLSGTTWTLQRPVEKTDEKG
ncbi:prepilin-type N-terminal cleavage/methylation domain-containing protein [Anthocerotibacter panamensis]|uniref:prepilin-type N-terminal cleavage/methylation domain-containing protein n=1 Tax=Anthocerotibacter panamensis TaxID=2857077 RepID=UPI001C40749E|nr:prepilin-type N-terminal cleavage/methylation domain-containing protein [Anthocerotibacter panamensis]